MSDSCQITPTNADQRSREPNAGTACSLPPDPSRPTRTTPRPNLQAGGRRFEPGTLHRMSSRVPDHGARIKAVETLLREGLGRVGEAEVVEPKIPRLIAEVQALARALAAVGEPLSRSDKRLTRPRDGSIHRRFGATPDSARRSTSPDPPRHRRCMGPGDGVGTAFPTRPPLGGNHHRPRLCAGLAPPDELVGVKEEPDGGDDGERGER